MNPTNDIRDIKGLVPLPGSHWWLWLLIAGIVLTALAWLIYRLRQQVQKPPVLAQVLLSPYDLAVQSLQQLLEDKLIESGQVDEFYTKLSDIVRRYLEGRFQLHAPERTTEEFLSEASRDGSLTPQHKTLLGAFLQECDLVKFARFRPDAGDMDRAFRAAENFVHDTRPRLQEEADVIPTAS